MGFQFTYMKLIKTTPLCDSSASVFIGNPSLCRVHVSNNFFNSVIFIIFKKNLTKMEFIYHKIHFKVYNSVAFSMRGVIYLFILLAIPTACGSS